jgi:hypothetical protein
VSDQEELRTELSAARARIAELEAELDRTRLRDDLDQARTTGRFILLDHDDRPILPVGSFRGLVNVDPDNPPPVYTFKFFPHQIRKVRGQRVLESPFGRAEHIDDRDVDFHDDSE